MQIKYLCVLIHIWIKGKVGAVKTSFSPPVKYFTDRSKAFFLLWIFYVFFLSCVCYAFVSVCLYVPCGHLLGKGWTLGSRVWCPTVSLSLSHWYLGSGVVLDCIDSCSLHPYLLWLSELFCLCCVAALKSFFTLSFNALIIPILRVVCTISFHYSCRWISSMSCTAFKITRWPIFKPSCITSAFYILWTCIRHLDNSLHLLYLPLLLRMHINTGLS